MRSRRLARDRVPLNTKDTSTADTLKLAAVFYLLKRGYSSVREIGLNKRGRLRGDVVAVNLKGNLVVCEIKSSMADYRSDTKWTEYLPYCHRFYFVVPERLYHKLPREDKSLMKKQGAGLMYLSEATGFLAPGHGARARNIDPAVAVTLITRLAWRGGISKRTHIRKRLYL